MKGSRYLYSSLATGLIMGLTPLVSAQPTPRTARPTATPTPRTARPTATPARPATPPVAEVTQTPTTEAVAPAAAVQPAPPPPPPPFRVAISSGINGSFSPVVCAEGDQVTPTLQRVAAQLSAEPGAFAIDVGDLYGAAAVSRYTAEHDAAGLATAVSASGLRVLAVGHRDLAARRRGFIDVANAIAQRDIPYVLSNLHCDATHGELCGAVRDASDPPVVIDTPQGRVGVVVLVDPQHLGEIARDRAAGLTLDALDDALPREVDRARAAGATRVIVTLDPGREHILRDAVGLAQAIEGDHRPDLIVVQDLDDGVLSVDTARASVPIVAARPDSVIVAEPSAAQVARRATTGTAPAPVTAFVNATHSYLCQTYSSALPGGRLATEINRDQFANLLLDVVRERSEAEVAVINRAAVRTPPGLFPIRGGLTPLGVTAALPFYDSLQVATIRGSVLRAFVTASRASGFYIRGVSITGTTVKVNGRALEDTQEYRVVTTGFVASEGTTGLGADIAFETFGDHNLQDIFVGWLQTPRSGNILEAPADPAETTRWYLRFSLDGTFTSVNIRNQNQSTYNDTQLTRAEATNLKLNGQFFAAADNPHFGFQNLLRVEYGLGRNQPLGGADTGFVETRDLISNRANFTWRVYRGQRRWYQPLPDAEGYIESEFDPPSSGDRTYHHLQLRPTVGARFDLTDRLYFRVGAGLDWEVFQPATPATGVFVTRLELNPGKLFSIGDRVVQGRFFADLSFRNPWDQMNMFLRAGVQLSVPLFNPLSLTMGYEIFGRAFDNLPFALAGDATVGLSVILDRSIQTY